MLTAITYLSMLQAKPVKLAPAVFADSSTRRIVELSKKAFSNLKSAKVTISSVGDAKTYSFAGGKVAGHQKGAQWVWSQKKLTVLCGKGLFRGTMGPYNVNAWLSKAGASPEILPIQLAAKRNPIEALINPGSRVQKVGLITLQGVAADVIEVKSDRLRVRMAIRQDNRLIADLTAKNVDKDGSVLFDSSRSFQWALVNKPIPSSVFVVGAGKAAKPIRGLEAGSTRTP